MSDRDSIKQRWYKALWKAYQEVKPIDSLTSTMGTLSVNEAYDVQAMLVEKKIGNGERVIGWKVGCTSQATMEQVKMDEILLW